MSELNHQELFELANRVDEACERFEDAWRAGEQPQIEDYLQATAETDRPDLLRDLLANELELLTNSGSHTNESAYGDRFPEYRDVVKAVFSDSAEHAFFGKLREYQLQQKLGEGGMGVVYKALHTRLKRSVAIKTLPLAMMHKPETVARFHREMEAVGQIDDPHVVRAHDAGEVDGTHYLVMEFVDGLDLQQLQERVGPLSVPNACEIIRQAALGLQSASNVGLVHRDIKPSNLMLTHSGTVKILDLGLAQMAAEADSEQKPGLTSTGQIMGTFDYLSPEQATDTKNVDIRSDIYSLGCTLFKLLTGLGPYASDEPMTAYQRIRAHLEDPIPTAAAVRADVTAELDALLNQMLAKQPAQRIQTPEELATLLAAFCDGHDLPALVTSATEVTSAEVDTASVGGQTVQYTAAVQSQRAAAVDGNETLSENAKRQSDTPVAGKSQTFLMPEAAASGRSRWTLPMAIVLTLAAGLGAYFSGLLTFTVKTDSGTIVLECDPAALQGAKIEVDGQEVRLTLAGDDQPVTIGVDKRRGQLRITKAGFKVFNKDFDIALGDNEHAIKVRLDPLEPVVMRSTTDPHRALAEWVVDLGGSVDLHHDGETLRSVGSTSDLPETSFTVQYVRLPDLAKVNDAHLEELRSLCRNVDQTFELQLGGTAVTDKGLAQLAGLTIWQIQLAGKQITDAGIEHLQNLKGLSGIGLYKTRVSNAGIALIAGMPGIESLNLTGTPIDDLALQHLRRLPNLKSLTVSDTNITDNGLEHLAVHRKLETLQSAQNQIGDAGIKHLAGLTELRRLDLYSSKVTDEGLRALADLKQLSQLNLYRTRITDESLKTIADTFPQLETLYVGACEIGDDGLKHLTRLKQLRTLDLVNTKVTTAGVTELHKTLPACRITYGTGQNPIIVDASAQDRRAAEWALSVGGTVHTLALPDLHLPANARTIKSGEDLPTAPFRVSGVDLDHNKKIDDAGLANLAGLSRIQYLHLRNTNVSDAGVRHLESLSSMQTLILDNTRVSDEGIQHLKRMHNLQTLYLHGTQITDKGVETLSQLPALQQLNVGDTQVTGTGLAMLKQLKQLHLLTLQGTNVADADLNILETFTELKILNVADLGVSDATLSRIATLEHLHTLSVGPSGQLTDDGLKHLASLNELKGLSVSHTNIGDAGLKHLENLQTLKSLHLDDTNITASGIARLAKALPELESLSVGQTGIGDEGLRGIGNLKLTYLQLDKMEITDTGLAHLSRLDTLETLKLTGSPITDEGLKHLAGHQQLRTLDLANTKVTAAGVAELQKALPDCHITWNAGAIEPTADSAP